jgi:hypothetical protein
MRCLMSKSKRVIATPVLLIPVILLCDIVAFALCFWWFDLGLRISSIVATLAPIVLLIGILIAIRFSTDYPKTRL